MEKPKIVLTDYAYQKIMYWVKKSSVEISGLGHVEYKENVFYVLDAFLLPQKNGATSTDIEPEDVCKAMFDRRSHKGELQFWWHSHVNMSAFWSGTDTSTMEKLSAGGWFISTVFNKRHEMRSALTMGQPFQIMIDELPTEVQRFLDEDLMKSMDKEYDDNVKEVSSEQQWRGNSKWSGDEGSTDNFHKNKKYRKRRGYKCNGKYYFFSGFETTESEIDVPKHLDFDERFKDAANPVIDKDKQLSLIDASEENYNFFYSSEEEQEEIIDIMLKYSCDRPTAVEMRRANMVDSSQNDDAPEYYTGH